MEQRESDTGPNRSRLPQLSGLQLSFLFVLGRPLSAPLLVSRGMGLWGIDWLL